MTARRLVSPVLLLVATACSGGDRPATAAAPPDWRTTATPADRARLREWRTAFLEGLEQARAGGAAAAVAAEGALLDPDAGGVPGLPPAGDYACRVLKLGARRAGGLSYVGYPAFRCRIEASGGLLRFRKQTGSQRPVGRIFDGDAGSGRPVFLGTLVLGDERRALPYGADPDRNMIGVFDSLPDGRWRLLLPRPAFESVMDVIELVPDIRGSPGGDPLATTSG